MMKYMVRSGFKKEPTMRFEKSAENVNNLRRAIIKGFMEPRGITKVEVDHVRTSWLEPFGYLYYEAGEYRWRTFGKKTEYIVSEKTGKIRRD